MSINAWMDELLEPPEPANLPITRDVSGLADLDERLPTWDVDGIDDPSEELESFTLPDGYTLPELPEWGELGARQPTDDVAQWWFVDAEAFTLDPAPARAAHPGLDVPPAGDWRVAASAAMVSFAVAQFLLTVVMF